MRLDLIDACTRALRAVLGDDAPSDAPLRWDIPKDPSFGDLSSSIAFKLAAKRRQPPHVVAQDLAARMQAACGAGSSLDGCLERVESKAGFLNLALSLRALTQTVESINRERDHYGHSPSGRGARMLIEFVSANPTGPLSVAHGRQAAVGDALARLLRSQGYDAMREYYLNDEGRQIEQLGLSLQIRYRQALGQAVAFPEDGYHGAYVVQSAESLVKAHRDQLLEKPKEWFIEHAMREQLARIKDDLARFGLTFETWTSQRDLRTSGKIDAVLKQLQDGGYLFDAEGATWFASTKFGDDKDRVVRKSTGELTYLAPDIAYHQQKCERGYDQLINLWGPDHHGYIARVKAALQALGVAPQRLAVKIVQLVTLSRHGAVVPMSKRQGEFVTFREILDEVGVDATRYFYLMRTMDSHLDFDLDLAKSQSQDNPVYYVQYAHARICSIAGVARTKLPWWRRLGPVRLEVLEAPEERLLMRQLFQFPLVLRMCAEAQEPHGVTSYLQRLAECFHVFYTKCRVVTDDVPRSRARLALISAARWTLANGLGVLGVSAPTRM